MIVLAYFYHINRRTKLNHSLIYNNLNMTVYKVKRRSCKKTHNFISISRSGL
jgi:hypothetical protein